MTIIVDTREQMPLVFTGIATRRGTLTTGDYSLLGLEHLIAVERKSLPDLVACIGHGRDRFKRELQRMRGHRFRLLVIEANMADLEAGDWRSALKPAHVMGSLASWTARYELPVMLTGTHEAAGRFVGRFMANAAKQIAEAYGAAKVPSEATL